MRSDTVCLLAWWYVFVLVGGVALAGNLLTILAIRHCKRARKLVNFFLCLLAANNTVVVLSALAWLIGQTAWYFYRDNAGSDRIDKREESDARHATLLRLCNQVRSAVWHGASGSQFWILSSIMICPKTVMTKNIFLTKRVVLLVALVLGLPYLVSFALEASTYFLDPGFAIWLKLVPACIFLLFHFFTFLLTFACRKKPQTKPANRVIRYVRTPTQGRSRGGSLSLYLNQLRAFRLRHRPWTSETCHVIAFTSLVLCAAWMPFYCVAFYQNSDSDSLTLHGDVTNAVTSFCCLSYCALYPLVLFVVSGKFRRECLDVFANLFPGKEKPKPNISNINQEVSRNKPLDCSKLQVPTLLPREPVVTRNNNPRSLSEDVTRYKERPSYQGNLRSMSLDIVSPGLFGDNSSSMHWGRNTRKNRQVHPSSQTIYEEGRISTASSTTCDVIPRANVTRSTHTIDRLAISTSATFFLRPGCRSTNRQLYLHDLDQPADDVTVASPPRSSTSKSVKFRFDSSSSIFDKCEKK